MLNARNTLNEMIDAMPDEGQFELYPFFRRMIHKFGFRCWAGEEAANEYLEKVRLHSSASMISIA